MNRQYANGISWIVIFTVLWSLLIPSFQATLVLAERPTSASYKENRTERIELKEYRTSNSKRFLQPNGTLTEEIYLGNVHYKNGTHWAEIENSFVQAHDHFVYKNKANRYLAEFAEETNGNRFMRFAVGEHAIEMRPIGLLTSSAKVQGNKITYAKGNGGNGLPISLEYTLGNDSLKEDIILDEYKKVPRLTFQMRLTNVTYKEEPDGSIGFYDAAGKRLWFFNRPYMVDSHDGYSDAVTMKVRKVGANLFIDLVPDDEWLKDASRVYPVRIDPTITVNPNRYEGRDSFVSQNYPNYNYSTSDFLSVGYSSVGQGVTRSMLWFRLPALPSGAWIQTATLSLYQYGSYSTTPTVEVYRATSDWDSASVNWPNQPTVSGAPMASLTQNGASWYNFNVSSAVQGWYTLPSYSNLGFVLKLADEKQQRRAFYSSDYTIDPNLRPKLVLNYDMNPLGREAFWTYAEDANVVSGNLKLTYEDVLVREQQGALMNLTRTYNSRSSNSGVFGYGWNSQLDVMINPVVKGPVQYIDEDRTVHYFEQLPDGTYGSPPGLNMTLIKNADGTFTVTEKDGVKYQFSSAGKLAGMADDQGNTVSYKYENGKITSIVDSKGRTTMINYGSNHLVSTFTDPAGRKTTYGYTTSGDLKQVIQAYGSKDEVTTNFEYDASHNLTAVTDPKGYKTYYSYNMDDRLQSLNPINKVLNAGFEVDAGADNIPDFWSYQEGQNGAGAYDLSSQTPVGYASLKIGAANANASSYSVYQSTQIPVDRTKTYSLSGYVKGLSMSGSQRTILSLIAYNSNGQSLGEFARMENTGTFAWKRISSVITADLLPVGTTQVRVKTAAANATGTGTSWFDAVQLEEGSETSEFVGPMTYTFYRPNMTSAFYDGNGKKLLFKYNENGNVTEKRIDPNGLNETTSYQWDTSNNLLSITNPNGQTRVVSANTSEGSGTNAPATEFEPSGNNLYDVMGNLIEHTDVLGHKTSYSYDLRDQLKSVSVSSEDWRVSYHYDANGNQTKVLNTNKTESLTYNATDYGYNTRNRLSSIQDPLGEITKFGYDASGNMNRIEHPNGNRVEIGYNKANRMDALLFNGTVRYTFAYDQNGNRTSMIDKGVNKTWGYTYDTEDRAKKITAPDGSVQEHSYDANGERSTEKITAKGVSYSTTYLANVTEHFTEVTDAFQRKNRMIYDENGILQEVILSNGTTAKLQYEEDRLKQVTNKQANGEVLSSFTYTPDLNGNVKTVTDESGKMIEYSYDGLNRLKSETDLAGNLTAYAYDALGNRESKVVKDASGKMIITTNYGYNAANQLRSVDGITYIYDKNGNLLDDGVKKYEWDAQGWLITVRKKSDSSLIAQYDYDADGKRVKSTVNGQVTHFHYDRLSHRVLYETDGNGVVTTLYTYSDDKLRLSMSKVGKGTYYYHYNGHGDVVQMTDQSGAVVARYTYDAWGNITSQSGAMAAENPYSYTGYRYDRETGLYYLTSRYYDANVGRFISQDDVKYLMMDEPVAQNLYAYVHNNPVNKVDPTGHFGLAKKFTKYALKKIINKIEDINFYKYEDRLGEDNCETLDRVRDEIVEGLKEVMQYEEIWGNTILAAITDVLISAGMRPTIARLAATVITGIFWG